MRKHLLLIAVVLLASACSTPKYTYHFDYYDYNSGKKQKLENALTQNHALKETEVLTLNEKALTAGSSETPVILESKAPVLSDELKENFVQKFKAMTAEEKKEFKKELKKEVKQYVKAVKKGDTIAVSEATKQMDRDLKMALIFGIIAIVLSLFGGANSVFWVLSVIALVVAIVFFIMWLARQ